MVHSVYEVLVKSNRSKKFKYILVYENISDKFDNGHCRIKVKVTVGIFSSFITMQTIRSYNSS